MKKIICSIALIMFVFLVGLPMQVFAQQTSIKLFAATPTFGTGPATSPAEAIPFASKSVILHFAEGDTAVVSSTPDGTGPIVIDNFLTINGQNACVGVEGQEFPDSCFGPSIQDPGDPGVVGMPVGTVLTPIPPIDVSAFIPVGTTTVVFELRDFGVIAGNTDLFLVTTAKVIPNPPPPPTLARAFDMTASLCKNRVTASVLETFGDAFEEQITAPILKGLMDVGADLSKIEQTRRRLVAGRNELMELVRGTISTTLVRSAQLPPVGRPFTEQLLATAPPPVSVREFEPAIATPQIKANQTINDILTEGFDPTKVSVEWPDIDFNCATGPVTPDISYDTNGRINLSITPRQTGQKRGIDIFTDQTFGSVGGSFKCTLETECSAKIDPITGKTTVECKIVLKCG